MLQTWLRLSLSFLVVFSSAATFAQSELARAERILREVPLIDGHNDLPWQFQKRVGNDIARIDLRADQSALTPALHTDLQRLRRGGVGGQFWSVYVSADLKGPDALRAVLEQIDVVKRMVAAYPDALELARTADDVVRIHKEGRIASLIGMEGGYAIANSLAVLRQLHELGAGYMTLTHSDTIEWADSATDDPEHDGLTPFGVSVIQEMNRLGMLVDLSHVSPATMHDAISASTKPVIFSHSSARAVTDHPRNVPDDVLRRMKENGGVVMITFVPGFISEKVRLHGAAKSAEEARLKSLYRGQPATVTKRLAEWEAANPAPKASIGDVVKHIEHVIRVAGEDHVGLGSDFDGIESTPTGLENVSAYPALLAELMRRGYSDAQLRKLVGLNILRVMRANE